MLNVLERKRAGIKINYPETKKNVTYLNGKLVITNVPHMILPELSPTGERFVRKSNVDLNLAIICKHMESEGIGLIDYETFDFSRFEY